MSERDIRVTLVDDRGIETSLVQPENVIRRILDPDTPAAFLEIPVPDALKGAIAHNFLHTSRIARLWIHDELS